MARRWEERRGRGRERQAPSDYDPEDVEAVEETLGMAFDRAWAAAIVRQGGFPPSYAADHEIRRLEAHAEWERVHERFPPK